MDNLTYFDFVSFDLITLIISSFDNDSLSNFLDFYGTTDFNWNYIYFLHFNRFIYLYEYYGLNLSYREYYDYLSIEKLKSVFNIEGETRNDMSIIRKLTTEDLKVKLLRKIPKEIKLLSNLTTLYLVKIKLRNIDELYQLMNLEVLMLNDNHLTEIRDSISNLQNLTCFTVGNNRITYISENLYSLKSLKQLGLHDNHIEYISDNITNLKNLVSLNIGGNPIIQFPTDLTKLKKLRVFAINNTKILDRIKLPLIKLNLFANNTFSGRVPDNLRNQTKLTKLFLARNNLNIITNEFDNLINLKELVLTDNNIKELNFSDDLNLEIIFLQNNNFIEFPISILNLSMLRTLDLGHNSISEISEEIRNLQYLRHLSLYENNIESLSLEGTNINYLVIYSNNLRYFVPNDRLKILLIFNNPIKNFSFLDKSPNITHLFIDKEQEEYINKNNYPNINFYVITDTYNLQKHLPSNFNYIFHF